MESVKSVASDFTRDWTRRLGYRRPGSGRKDKAKVAQRLPGGRPAKPESGPPGQAGAGGGRQLSPTASTLGLASAVFLAPLSVP